MVSLELEMMLQERDASCPKSNCDCEGVRDKQCILSGFLPQLQHTDHKVSDKSGPLAGHTSLGNPFTAPLHHVLAPSLFSQHEF